MTITVVFCIYFTHVLLVHAIPREVSD